MTTLSHRRSLRAVFALGLFLHSSVSVLAEEMKVTRPNSNPLREALQPVPETAIFKMDGHYLWDPSLICTDWEAKVTGVRKAVVYYTSKNGVDYELYSRIPVWSQNDPVPLVNGQSLKISGVERPQVFLGENGAVIALLASVYSANKDTDPTFIIVRPVGSFIPGT